MIIKSQELKVKTAAKYGGFSHAKLAEAIGMTAQNFSQKMKRNTFTDEELKKIADTIGAEFIQFSFKFTDGQVI